MKGDRLRPFFLVGPNCADLQEYKEVPKIDKSKGWKEWTVEGNQ